MFRKIGDKIYQRIGIYKNKQQQQRQKQPGILELKNTHYIISG